MPIKLNPNMKMNKPFIDTNVNYRYKYKNGLNLKPGTDLHDYLVEYILERAQESRLKIADRFDSWREIDRTMSAYIHPDDVEKIEDVNKTTPIVIPMSYATLETIMTYMTATFMTDHIFKYTGHGPEDKVKAILLENAISLQTNKYRAGLNLHTQISDSFKYGIGVVTPFWHKMMGYKQTDEFGDKQLVTLFEGNKMLNISVYNYLPDPNVSAHEVQDGEFVGWVDNTNFISLMELERDNPDEYFNVKYLDGVDGLSSILLLDSSGDDRARGTSDRRRERWGVTSPVDVIYMIVNLIPSSVKTDKGKRLGDGEYPEKWLFAVAADSVIIMAQRLNLNHNMFPVTVAAPDYDGYSPLPTARLEIAYGLQDTMDWLFQSHIANVKKSLNDMLVVDPSLINMNDLINPGPGRLIRLRQTAWGRGVNDAVKQLEVNDTTRGHINDAIYLTDVIRNITGAVDIVSGIVRTSGERVSATEARDSKQAALSRLAKSARIISLQSMSNLAYMYASQTQQFMSEEVYVKVTGELEEVLMRMYGRPLDSVLLKPDDLNFEYDIVEHDGSQSGGESVDAWIQMYQILAQNPAIGQQFDMVRIFTHIAQQMGAKDVDSFRKKFNNMSPQLMQDENVINEVDKGNLIPAGNGAV